MNLALSCSGVLSSELAIGIRFRKDGIGTSSSAGHPVAKAGEQTFGKTDLFSTSFPSSEQH